MHTDDARFLRDLFVLAHGDRWLAFFADQIGAHQGMSERRALACVDRLEGGGFLRVARIRGHAPLVRITEKGAREARELAPRV